MKKINIRKFRANMKKCLDRLPFELTSHGKTVARVVDHMSPKPLSREPKPSESPKKPSKSPSVKVKLGISKEDQASGKRLL